MSEARVALAPQAHRELAEIRANLISRVKFLTMTREEAMDAYKAEVQKRVAVAMAHVDDDRNVVIECRFCSDRATIPARVRTFTCECRPLEEQFTFQQRVFD